MKASNSKNKLFPVTESIDLSLFLNFNVIK